MQGRRNGNTFGISLAVEMNVFRHPRQLHMYCMYSCIMLGLYVHSIPCNEDISPLGTLPCPKGVQNGEFCSSVLHWVVYMLTSDMRTPVYYGYFPVPSLS